MNAIELALVLLSALLHAIWSAAIKGARSPLAFGTAQQLVEVPLAATALFFFPVAELPGEIWALLAATGLAHGLYGYWMTLAYARADLTRVYPIIRSTPALLPLLAIPLGEVVTPLGALGIAIVMAGVWLVYGEQLSLGRLFAPELVYAWLTLGTTVAYSFADKLAMTQLHAGAWSGALPRPLAWYALLTLAAVAVRLPLALGAIGARAIAGAARDDLGRIALSVCAGLVGYGLILHVMQTAPASYVVAVRQLSVLFAVAIATRFLGERPSAQRLAGAALTVAGVATIAAAG
ncbi:MAG TPA: EamA family transporter [Myxococcota bacterium]|nr:EamA family transporter [Myxococcota bacterium]